MRSLIRRATIRLLAIREGPNILDRLTMHSALQATWLAAARGRHDETAQQARRHRALRPLTPEQARRIARRMLGKVADGQDPADKRARARSMPTLCEAFQDYLSAKSFRSTKTSDSYRRAIEHYLADWVSRPLNAIERREVEARFALLTREHGWAIGNQVISLLRSIYRRACVDHEGCATRSTCGWRPAGASTPSCGG